VPDRLVRKLEILGRLTPADCAALAQAPGPARDFPRDADMVSEGDRPSVCILLLQGLACRYRSLSDGRRQILAFQFPGDIVDLQGFVLRRMDHSVMTLTRCRAAPIGHDVLRRLVSEHPPVGLALWRDTLVDAAMLREWVVGLGQRPAYERMAHLFCEVAYRVAALGGAPAASFDFPVTQVELGDALGLSVVHVNRVMQRLRAEGLLSHRGGTVTIHDWGGLRLAGDFDPGYLHPEPTELAERAFGIATDH